MYVYIQNKPNTWTSGFYSPGDEWNPDMDFSSAEGAASRVAWLNGSGPRASISGKSREGCDRSIVVHDLGLESESSKLLTAWQIYSENPNSKYPCENFKAGWAAACISIRGDSITSQSIKIVSNNY